MGEALKPKATKLPGVISHAPALLQRAQDWQQARVAANTPTPDDTYMLVADLLRALEAKKTPHDLKLMVHCEGCGGFAHFGLDAFDGMESGTMLPPCEECGQQMTVLLCKDGEYQRYLAAPSSPSAGWQNEKDVESK